jgi:protein-S-isoprenylcysteine O-methyltransferase Ste14
MGINEFFPLQLPQAELLWWLGPCLFLLALILAGLGFREFFRARNRPPPNKPIRELMTGGPYRITRNPLYLSLALIHAGIGFVTGTPWVLLSLPPTLLVIRYYVIAREEAYLIRRFGERYLDYQARVRRWF